MPDRRGFPRAVGAEEPEHLALVHMEGDVEHAPPGAIVLRQGVHINNTHKTLFPFLRLLAAV